jgi:hypothetical protein
MLHARTTPVRLALPVVLGCLTIAPLIGEAADVGDVVAVNPFAFEGYDASDGDALRAAGVSRSCERSDGLDCLLEAPLVLPTGTTITRIELDAIDNGVRDVKLNLNRCPVGTSGCFLVAEVETSGTPGATQQAVDLTEPEVIDNSSFTYLLEVFPGNDATLALLGARVYVTPSQPADTDAVAMPPYAFEARTSSGRNSLAVSGIQRFCSGVECEVLASVELASGTVVTRLDLDAHDSSTSDNVTAEFERCGRSTGVCTSLASLATSGSPGATQPGVDLPMPETIDNENFSYVARVGLGDTDQTRLVGLRLSHTRPMPAPRFDTDAINAFAFEGLDANAIDAIEAVGSERYCSGQVCVLRAPVLLRSGTAVRGLGLAAYDAGAGAVTASLERCAVGATSCTTIAEIGTERDAGGASPEITISPSEIINNRDFTYVIEVALDEGSAYRLRAAFLEIDNRLFLDGFESGDTTAWTTTVD